MTLPKVLYAALTGCLFLIVSLVGSWMHGVQSQQEAQAARLAAIEQHYVAIQTDLQYLRAEIQDLRAELKEEAHARR